MASSRDASSYFFKSKLNKSQQEVIQEIYSRGMVSGGLALPLGFGKTRVGLVLGLSYNQGKILAVVSKTLLASWIDELEKLSGKDFVDEMDLYEELNNQVKFEVCHSSFMTKKDFASWKPKPETQIVLTTPEVLAEAYESFSLSKKLLEYVTGDVFGPTNLRYHPAGRLPFTSQAHGIGFLFSYTWGCVLIDEIQRHTNIETDKCRAIACLSSHHKWGMSGTMFDEPKITRFLGFFVMLGLPGPRQITEARSFIAKKFAGFRQFTVFRKDNAEFVDRPEYNEVIVKHKLSEKEKEIFLSFREVVNDINEKMKRASSLEDFFQKRQLSAHILAMITYVRQALVCPIIPLRSLFKKSLLPLVDVVDVDEVIEVAPMAEDEVIEVPMIEDESVFSKAMKKALQGKRLEMFEEDSRYTISTRFQAVMDKLQNHNKERCIVFSAFRSTLDCLMPFVKGREILTIIFKMTVEQRRDVLQRFSTSNNAILFITYDIGAEGLNLQCASVVMLMDLWWNSAKLQQSIGRIYRPGQLAPKIFVYMFISDTGMEEKILEKNNIKAAILSQLQVGSVGKFVVPKMSIEDVIAIINLDENESMMKSLRIKRKIEDDEDDF